MPDADPFNLRDPRGPRPVLTRRPPRRFGRGWFLVGLILVNDVVLVALVWRSFHG